MIVSLVGVFVCTHHVDILTRSLHKTLRLKDFHYHNFTGGGSPHLDYEKQEFGFNEIRKKQITQPHRRICYNQTVYDDIRLEETEYAGLTLEVQDLVQFGGPTTANAVVDIKHAAIKIIDNDGMY